MATIQLLAPQQAAITLPGIDTMAYQYVLFSSDLASTDTVTVLLMQPNGAGVVAPDVNGITTGLSATVPCRVYFGGPNYVLSKVGAIGVSGIYLTPGGDVT